MQHFPACAWALLVVFLLCWGCAVPVGPGFAVEQQSYEVQCIPGSPARLRVRASYRLKNAGNSELAFLEVALPDAASFGRQNLRVQVDDREVSAPAPMTSGQAPADARAGTIQIPFDPPWLKRQKRRLVLEYDLAPAPPGHAGITVSETAAHLRHFGWFPELRPPDALFARGGDWPEKVRFTLRVPQGWRAVAGGHEKGARRRAGEAELRYELRGEDNEPYLVAGRYVETREGTPYGTVVFWTFQPLDPAGAGRAAARIAASYRSYETFFGPLGRKPQPVFIVESSAQLAARARDPGEADPAGIGFPAGALLNRRAFELGVTSDLFLDLAEHELAHAWFGQALDPRPEAEVLLSEALAEYATLVAAETRQGAAARQRHAALLLRWYDESRAHAAEPALIALRPADPYERRVFGYSKGALFFVALEDEFGKENVRRALARLVQALGRREDTARGGGAGLHELRAALELEAGRDAAGFFRLWLNRPGLPAEFRARYELHAE